MTQTQRMSRKALTIGVIVATALWSLMAAAFIAPSAASAAGCVSGTLIKGSLPAVYYCGADGKRYVFTNDKAFFTWYADFSGVTILSDAALGEIPIGGNVTYRPGKKMIKIQSDPKVYVINRGGVLKHVPDESCAATLYGSNWNKQIDDVSDSFFVNYKVGTPLATCSDFDKTGEMNVSVSINIDKNLTGAIVLPAVTSVTPSAGATGVALDADVSATFSKKMKASTLSDATFTLTASASGAAAVAGTVTVSEQTATFNPSANLAADTTYRATITTGAKDQDDRGLTVDYSWTFTTAAAASAAVTVTAITPPDGGTGVATSTPITATFSGAMNASTITTSTFRLKQGSSTVVPGSVSLSGNVATYTPTAALLPNTTYTVEITSEAKDTDGDSISGGTFFWSFTTAS